MLIFCLLKEGMDDQALSRNYTINMGLCQSRPVQQDKDKKRTCRAPPPNVTLNRPVPAASEKVWSAQSVAAAAAWFRKWRKLPGVTKARLRALPGGKRCINDALPEELIGQILRQLPHLSDLGRARCVCKTWKQVGASPFHRPASPLWCLLPEGGWRTIDMASGREGKIDYPGTAPDGELVMKGQGGLVAVQDSDGTKYWICNPLLNKWHQVPVSAEGWIRWSTSELLAIAHAGSEFPSFSYKIVRVSCKHYYSNYSPLIRPRPSEGTLQTEIYDSQSRVWTRGAFDQGQGMFLSVQALRSCVWRSVVYVLLGDTLKFDKFSIWEYHVENNTLTEAVPWASLPDPGRGCWSRNTPFQVQVRTRFCEHGATTHLVLGPDPALPLARPRAACYAAAPLPFQVFAWDPSLERWSFEMEVATTAANQPPRNIKLLPGPWDIHGKSGSASVPELLFGCQNCFVTVCRTDVDTAIAGWHCNMRIGESVSYSYKPVFCLFPSLDAQP